MLAIPIDQKSYECKSSELFGNVEAFAVYDPKQESIDFLTNTASGNGIKTAELLHSKGIESVVYSYMGDGPFNKLFKKGIKVHFIGKEPLSLQSIIEGLATNNFVEVTDKNAKEYLDPGTATANCECGCTNE